MFWLLLKTGRADDKIRGWSVAIRDVEKHSVIQRRKKQPIRKKREPPTSLQSAVLEGPVIRINHLLLTDNLSSV